jgi:hypothetical protein
MRNPGFKYNVGDVVTHVGFLKPIRRPTIQRFIVVTRTLVAGPGGSQRIYYVRPAREQERQLSSTPDTLRVHEEHLAFLPEAGVRNEPGESPSGPENLKGETPWTE